jgi:hypothetical protein
MKTKMSGVTKLVLLAKTQTGLAAQLGLTQSAISLWVANDYVPKKHITDVINLYPQLTAEELIKQK